MIYLIGSVLLSAYLTLSFKVLQRLHIAVLPAIVFNYITCVITGLIINKSWPINSGTVLLHGWFMWAMVLGCLFIVLFNIIAITTQKIGVAVASVANKLSMIIPILFFIIVHNEPLNTLKIIGFVLALIAVVLTCYTKATNKATPLKSTTLLLPIILFVGSGMLDTLYKYVYDLYLANDDETLNHFLVISFGTAGFIGFLYLMYLYISGKLKFDYRAVLAGIIIGLPNYFSIWCLGKLYKANLMESSEIISLNNMAIVLVSTVAALFLFKEKLSKINWLGITFAILAIVLISFNKYL